MVDNEIDDFDLEPAEYQTLFHVFDERGACFGTQPCACHDNPEEAIKFAKIKANEMRSILSNNIYNWDGQTVFGAAVTVETVITVDGEQELAGTLFNETVFTKLG